MKRVKLSMVVAVALSFAACSTPQRESVELYSEGFKFCEGTTSYDGKILVTNFGCEAFEPLNQHDMGYVLSIEGGEVSTFIECDSTLSAHKGLYVVGDYILIADVGKVVSYNLADREQSPQIIPFAEGELFVNDIVAFGDKVLVSVTNSGNIYSLDIAALSEQEPQTPQLVGNVAGANGLVSYGDKVYIASYNPQRNPSEENVIYVATLQDGALEVTPLVDDMQYGQYDGIAISEDGERLLVSSWVSENKETPAIWSISIPTGQMEEFVIEGVDLTGPADITISDGRVWIPELVDSKLYGIAL